MEQTIKAIQDQHPEPTGAATTAPVRPQSQEEKDAMEARGKQLVERAKSFIRNIDVKTL